MFRLDGKVSLVTGAASGIGEAIARRFALTGSTVIVADRDEVAGLAVVSAIQKENGAAHFIPLDVAVPESCRRLVAELLERTSGRIDILVNNAGVGHVGNILATTEADLERLWAVNVQGVFSMTKAVLPEMLRRRSGSVVNLSSVGGIVGIRDRVAYCATKAAVVGLTKSLALDHAAAGIRFNCICPGRIQTPFVEARLREYPDPAKAYQEMAATQALGRMGRADEVAAAALYLASDEASFITGSALMIDGGWSAGK